MTLLLLIISSFVSAATPSDWYFHTGRGYIEVALTQSGGEVEYQRVPCELDETDTECRELVYYFTDYEIQQFVDQARKLYEERINSSQANIATGILIASWAGRTAYTALFAPPQISILTGILSGIATLGSAAYTSWEGYRLSELYELVGEIDGFIAEEQRYVNRCGHVRSNFHERLGEYGINLIFPRNGGVLQDSRIFFEARRKDDQARETREQRIRSGTSEQRANRLYNDGCAQMPRVDWMQTDGPGDNSLDYWTP